jgi:hypothetical protein
MSVIYLKHQTHGTKVACAEAEAKADEARGWVRYDPAAVPVSAPAGSSVNALAPDTLESVRKQYQEKFGREPHHRKSIETLRAELGAH